MTILVAGGAALAPLAAAAPDQHRAPTTPHVDDVQTAGRGRLGLVVIEPSPELRAQFGAPRDRGVLVDRVVPDSPAALAGLRVGDVVIEVDGDAVTSGADIIDAMSDHNKGEQVLIVAMRAGKRVQLSATLNDDPGPRMPRTPSFSRPFDDFDQQAPRIQEDVRRELDAAKRRIDELERRLDKLERT